jgi:hypothetical protein
MDVRYYINTWRKFWNFLEGLYPVLGRAREKIRLIVIQASNALGLTAFFSRIGATQRAQTIKVMGERFLWRDLSQDRQSLANLSPEAMVILRPVFLLSLVLCFVLPATLLFPFPAIAPSAISGASGPVAGWSVMLWALATALAWGCLLAGVGTANRPACVLAADLYLYIMMVMPPIGSKLNFIPVATALLATGVCEYRMKRPGLRDISAGLGMCLLVGLPCGALLWKSLPAWSLFRDGGLTARLSLGTLLSMAVFFFGRAREADSYNGRILAYLFPLHRTVFTVTILTLIFLTSLAFWVDLGAFGNVLLRGQRYLTSFFWPVWYFIGVGIIFKLLKNSKIIVGAMRDLVRPSLFIPLAILAIAAGAAITVSYNLIMFTKLWWWPPWILKPAWVIYSATKASLWQSPMHSFSLEPMTWVFLFDLFAVLWLLLKRMLDAERVAALLFFTLLVWLLLSEYYFECFSMARSPEHSVIILLLSPIWLLWFIHALGLRISKQSSPMWPDSARLPAYGALLLFVLLEFHARTAIRDYNVLNEIFYYLFRGIVDVGLPFVLYVYAGRQFSELPVPLSRLFGFFCFGGACTIPMTILDKLAVHHWSWSALRATVDTEFSQWDTLALSASNQIPTLPTGWVLSRGALGMAILFVVTWWVRRSSASRSSGPAQVIFFPMAMAMGMAAFSNTLIVLPFVPPRWELFYRPFYQSLMLDHYLFFLYLTYGIPTLTLTLSFARPGCGVGGPAVGVAVAVLIHLGLALAWPAHSGYLKATGLADTLVVGGLAFFSLLIYQARRRVDAMLLATDAAVPTAAVAEAVLTESAGKPVGAPQISVMRPVVGPMARAVFIGLGAILFCGVALLQWKAGPIDFQFQSAAVFPQGVAILTPGSSPPLAELPPGFSFRDVPGLVRPLPLSDAWTLLPADKTPSDLTAMFIRREKGEWKPTLFLRTQPFAEGNAWDLLRKIDEELEGDVTVHYQQTRIEDWGAFFPGAVAEDYRFDASMPDGRTFHLNATTLLLPQVDGTVWILSAACDPADWDIIRTELAKSAEVLGHGEAPRQ